MNYLDPVAEKSKIIGLGEATHGSAEFFNAKARIFKHLVKKHGYRVSAFENFFGGSLIINKEIQKGNTSQIEKAMRGNVFGAWYNEEVRSLLEWMCEYNQGKTKEEKVHFMGIDCQHNNQKANLIKDYFRMPMYVFSLLQTV